MSYCLREKADKKFSRYNEDEYTSFDAISSKKTTTTKKSATKRKINSSEMTADDEIDENSIIDLPDDCSIQASINGKQDETPNCSFLHETEFLKLKKERDAYDLKLKEQGLLIEEKLKIIEQQKEFIEMVCSNMKHDFMCKLCKQILDMPIELPCSITICQSHLEKFVDKNCTFCLQTHQISSDANILNENLTKRIQVTKIN